MIKEGLTAGIVPLAQATTVAGGPPAHAFNHSRPYARSSRRHQASLLRIPLQGPIRREGHGKRVTTEGKSPCAGSPLAWVMFLSSCLIAPGANLSAADAKPNVIFITIDTLRADHLGCYGYRRVQTPNIDALAHSAARFSHAFTPVPITLPAHTSIFTGSYPMAEIVAKGYGVKLHSGGTCVARVPDRKVKVPKSAAQVGELATASLELLRGFLVDKGRKK